MRIISGKYRGMVLAQFGGKEIRPTADRVKESLFNILSGEIAGASVLDLFCGSGNLGIECLSRGAARVHSGAQKKPCEAERRKLYCDGKRLCALSFGRKELRFGFYRPALRD